MRFMRMMHHAGEGAAIHIGPPADAQAHIRFMLDLDEQLETSGELVDAQGLAGPEQARLDELIGQARALNGQPERPRGQGRRHPDARRIQVVSRRGRRRLRG